MSDNSHKTTIDTYDKSAAELAEYFKGHGNRVDDIKLALKLTGSPKNAKVVEVGCGDGRDAAEIIKRVSSYIGFDPSEGMLKLARKNVPKATFVKADALGYDYPKDLDVVYALSSLLHVNKEDFKKVLGKIHDALRQGGILLIDQKGGNTYKENMRQDEFGSRMFYNYNPELVKELAGSRFEAAYQREYSLGDKPWFVTALKKI